MAGHVRQVLLLWRRLLRRAAGRRSVTYRYLPRRTAELGAVTTRINTGDGLGFLPASSSPPFSTAITSQRLHFLSTSTAFKMPSYIVSNPQLPLTLPEQLLTDDSLLLYRTGHPQGRCFRCRPRRVSRALFSAQLQRREILTQRYAGPRRRPPMPAPRLPRSTA